MKYTSLDGLTVDEVNERIKNNKLNKDVCIKTKSYKQIAIENIFTLFNIINLFLGIIIISVNAYKNLTFLGVAFINTIISMVQEMRCKRTVDKLAIISKTKVNSIRDKKDVYIDINEIVMDDIIKYKLGDQIVVDCIIRQGKVQVNESLLTGESDPIIKNVGDKILSGSFIISGGCTAQVVSVGEDSYANKITKEAKYLNSAKSEIMVTLNKIIKIISVLIIPLGIVLFLHQLKIASNISDAVIGVVAALIGTIPEGLILLTSTVFAISSIRLSNKNVLVQELYCIENLAHVDTICLDKTGTLTTGNMKVVDTIKLDSKYDINSIMDNISYYIDNYNPTSCAIGNYFKKINEYKLINKIDFSSDKKYSVYEFDNNTYILGAPEFINCDDIDYSKYSEYRVLLLGVNKEHIKDNKVDDKFKPIGLILIEDEIRKGAKDTLNYLKNEDVDIKIISGDNINTIESIARKIGIDNIKLCDMSKISGDTDYKDIVLKYNIFGRVTPSQKKKIIVTLKSMGHKVAMTGDGVNDVLSLKESDCSISMSNGSDAARNVSQIVLLDNDFKVIPLIIKEGRRSINNLERSSSLFLTKTIYSIIIAILFVFINMDYPFIPIQLTLISVLTIGIPSFVLALEPNYNRVKGHFFMNIISKSLPAAITIVVNIITILAVSNVFKFNDNYISTMSVILVAFTGFVLLFKVCYPFNCIRVVLYISLICSFIFGCIGLNQLFELVLLTPNQFIIILILCILDIILFNILSLLCDKVLTKYEKRINTW